MLLLVLLYQMWEDTRKGNLIIVAKAFVLCVYVCAIETLAPLVYFALLPISLMPILKEV